MVFSSLFICFLELYVCSQNLLFICFNEKKNPHILVCDGNTRSFKMESEERIGYKASGNYEIQYRCHVGIKVTLLVTPIY